MNLQFFALIFALLFSAQSIASLDNPFGRATDLDVGADIKWAYKDGAAKKISKVSDNDDIFYELSVGYSELKLRLVDSASIEAARALSFEQLVIEDVLLDGKPSSVFRWCLNNQQRHNSFLQQGLKVKKDICKNRGAEGLFEMMLNRSTHDLLKKTKRLTFVVKPYRKAVNISFDVPDLSTVFARLSGATVVAKTAPKKMSVPKPSAPKPVAKFLSQPAVKTPVATTMISKPIKMCKVNPPTGFPSIKAVEYRCDDNAAKTKARSKIAVGVKKVRLKKEKKEKMALERKRMLQQLEAEKAREAEAVSIIDKIQIRYATK